MAENSLTNPENNDYTGGDHSFKNWFKIMWGNWYIQLFIIGFGGIVFELIKFNDVIDTIKSNFDDGVGGGLFTIFGVLVPWLMCIAIGYKGFYQFWNDLKSGNSR